LNSILANLELSSISKKFWPVRPNQGGASAFKNNLLPLDIVSSKITLNVAEQLIEEGNTLSKACVKKMHPPSQKKTFAEGQQNVEIHL